MPLVNGLVFNAGESIELCVLAYILCDVSVLSLKLLFIDIVFASKKHYTHNGI